jgi:hypothetical protein
VCTFNTLLLPASTDLDAVNEVASATLHQTFEPQGNAAIEAAVGDVIAGGPPAGGGARSYVKRGNCDCGSGLARVARPTDTDPTDRELRKLRSDGWSEAKIRRWLDQRAATQQKRRVEYEARHGGLPASAAAWAAFVGRLLDEGLAPWVGLFTHEYRGSVATERIEIGAVRRHVGISVEQIGEIEEDVAFVFVAG